MFGINQPKIIWNGTMSSVMTLLRNMLTMMTRLEPGYKMLKLAPCQCQVETPQEDHQWILIQAEVNNNWFCYSHLS